MNIIFNEVHISKEEKNEFIIHKENLKDIREKIIQISKYFNDIFIDNLFISNELILLDVLIKTIEDNFNYIKNYDIKKKKFLNNEIIMLNHFVENSNNGYVKKLKNTYYLKWIENIEKELGDILMTIDEYDTLKLKAFNLIQRKKSLIPEYIEKKLNDKISDNFQENRVGNEIFYKNLITEARKKRKKLSLRKYIEAFEGQGLFDIIPCWLLTPEVVSEILPFQKEFFDIVIFDEASQMFVEKSIPSIFRSKKVVVAGDDKQLKPNVIGNKRIEEENELELLDDEEYIDDSAIEVESLLDLAKERYKSTLLSYHYRSKYPELISFSNYAFYEGKLITSPNKKKFNEPPIEVLKIDNGSWENQSNAEEAKKVYELIKKLLVNRKKNESLGVVTFNAKQQNTIKNYLDEVCEKDIEFRSIYEKEKIRYDGTEDKSLFVKNIENVQGDERDIIIFSTAYAKDIKTGKVASRFGTLSQSGGENRLNVAISRAKIKIYIITSIEPEELNVEKTKNNGPKFLKKYLQYAKNVSTKETENNKELLLSSKIMIKENEKNSNFDFLFEKEVCKKLREKKYIVHPQVGDFGYKIDLAIYDENASAYLLGIECDGATYYNSESARERDIFRLKFLELNNWNMHRIWSKNWWKNPEKEIQKIIEKVENY